MSHKKKMTIEIKGFEVQIGAGMVKNSYTLNIPALKIFKTYKDVSGNWTSQMEAKAREILKEH